MKWWTYVLCVLVILSGVICGGLYYDKVQEQSAVYGSGFDLSYDDSSTFDYHSTGIKLTETDPSTYVYERDNLAAEAFDAQKREYELWLNDVACIDFSASYGKAQGVFSYRFYDVDGTVACETRIRVTLTFYSTRTHLLVESLANGVEDNYDVTAQIDAIEDYFALNGFHLLLNEV